MRDEGDMIAGPEPEPEHYSAWGIAWRVALTALTLYVLLTAAFVLYGKG